MKSAFPNINAVKLKEARELAGLSKATLAKQLCLGEAHITQLENDECHIFFGLAHKVATAKKVAKALNLKESDFLSFEQSITSSKSTDVIAIDSRYPFDENSVSLFKKLVENSKKIRAKLFAI